MATLDRVRGGSLVPNLSDSLGILRQGFGTPETRAANERQAEAQNLKLQLERLRVGGIQGAVDAVGGGNAQAAINQLTPGFAGPVQPGGAPVGGQPVGGAPAPLSKSQKRAFDILDIVAPAASQSMRLARESGDKQALADFRLEAEKGAKQAVFLNGLKTFEEKQAELKKMGAQALREGRPTDKIQALLNEDEEGLDRSLRKMIIAGKSLDALTKPTFEDVTDAAGNITAQRNRDTNRLVAGLPAVKAQTDIGQARGDLKGGLITKDEFNTIKNAPKKAQSKVGKLIADRRAAASLYPAGSPQIKALDAAIKGEASGKPVKLSDVNALRGQFTRLAGDFIDMRDAIGKVQSAAANPSAAGDLALIFNYMKILDPSSVVRESEFETAQNAASLGGRIGAAAQRVVNGERLTDDTRADFVGTANRLFGSQEQKQEALETSFRDIATRSGMNPDNVVIDFRGAGTTDTQGNTQAPPPAAGPAEGTTATNPQTGETLTFKDGQWQAL